MDTIIVCPECGAKNRISESKKHLAPKCGRCQHSLQGQPVSGKVNELTDSKWHTQVDKAALPVLVDFYSPTCGPCRMLAPILDKIAAKFAGKLLVFKVDTSRQQANAARFHLRGVPTLIFFNNGATVDQIVGAVPQEEIERHILQIIR